MLTLCFIGLPSIADELGERRKVDNQVSYMFLTERFNALDKIADDYRQTEDRTSSGLWKLTLLYAGLYTHVEWNGGNDEHWQMIKKKALKWIEIKPESPTPHLVYAGMLYRQAWKQRGIGSSENAKAEGLKSFYKYLTKAKELLYETKKMASKDPRWYELMIKIAKAEGWSKQKFATLLSEATSRHPYFYQIYFVAIEYLSPSWHGSKEEIEIFARNTIAHTSEEEDQGMYARIYWYASQVIYDASLFTNSSIDWDRMSASIDDVLERYPDQWNINNFAFFACLAGDQDKTARLISQITGEPILRAWRNKRFFNKCKKWALIDAKV